MISAWTLVCCVIMFVGAYLYALKTITDLRHALNTKDVLIDGELSRRALFVDGLAFNGASVSAGGTLVQTYGSEGVCVRIKSSRWTRLEVRLEKI